jgi:Ca2+-binding RTX toxin-like protein
MRFVVVMAGLIVFVMLLGGPASAGIGVDGTAGADHLSGTSASDLIFGLGGDDTLRGRAGDDRLVGGHGDDLLQGGPGMDTFICGPGDDLVVVDGSVREHIGNGCEAIISGPSRTL